MNGIFKYKSRFFFVLLIVLSLIFISGCDILQAVYDGWVEGGEEGTEVEPIVQVSEVEEEIVVIDEIAHYKFFNQTEYDFAVGKKVILLYFLPDWCSECKAERDDLKIAFDDMLSKGEIYDVVGFEVPYQDDRTLMEHERLELLYGILEPNTKLILGKDETVKVKDFSVWTKVKLVDEINNVRALN